MAKLRVEREIAPACWASYLVNGDASGLDDDDIKAADAWLEGVGGEVVDAGRVECDNCDGDACVDCNTCCGDGHDGELGPCEDCDGCGKVDCDHCDGGTVDEEPWFTWGYAEYGGTARGGDVITYTLHYYDEEGSP